MTILAAGLVGQLVLSLYWTREGWLGVDGLYYISSRGGLPGDHTSIFAPYAGHWQPVLISLYLVLWWTFGLHSYVPYVLPAILAHLVICALLYGLLRRVGLGPWVPWSRLGPPLVRHGRRDLARQRFLRSHLSDRPCPGRAPRARPPAGLGQAPWVACALLTVSLGISATAVIAVLLVALFALGARGFATCLRVALVPTVVFATWFLVSGHSGGRVRVSAEDLLGVPRDALSVLVLPLGDVAALATVGPLLTLGIVLVTVLARVDNTPLRALALAGIGAAGAQTCLSVLANAQLSLESWGVGRYRYVVLTMLVPAFALTLHVVVERARDVLGPTTAVVGVLSSSRWPP